MTQLIAALNAVSTHCPCAFRSRQKADRVCRAPLLEAELALTTGTAPGKLLTELLYIGMLVGDPGADPVELNYPGYRRQVVELSARNADYVAVGRPVIFEIFGCPPITGLALFDVRGQVVANGAVQGLTSDGSQSRFEFASHQILVRRHKAESFEQAVF